MDGYLCKKKLLFDLVEQEKTQLISEKKLPLILDLDDTCVRMVTNWPEAAHSDKVIPVEELPMYAPERQKQLKSGTLKIHLTFFR